MDPNSTVATADTLVPRAGMLATVRNRRGVEAGLILTELLLRRRIQRVLVLTPASLRQQWREELWEKFSLRFEVVDRQGTERLRRGLGMDATPWRSFSRIVASYHYLRQPDVLEQFLAACRTPEGSPHLPWDLLIVDECHNLMPSPFGEDSELCRMLRLVAPQFEHRLFLSATPHNGHTRSFTGLLEMLELPRPAHGPVHARSARRRQLRDGSGRDPSAGDPVRRRLLGNGDRPSQRRPSGRRQLQPASRPPARPQPPRRRRPSSPPWTRHAGAGCRTPCATGRRTARRPPSRSVSEEEAAGSVRVEAGFR